VKPAETAVAMKGLCKTAVVIFVTGNNGVALKRRSIPGPCQYIRVATIKLLEEVVSMR
jgi:hypothetical protein